MKTYQLANEGRYGTAKKIAPMTTESVKNQLSCFQTEGDADEPVQPQGILPDISSFKVCKNTFMFNIISHYLTLLVLTP